MAASPLFCGNSDLSSCPRTCSKGLCSGQLHNVQGPLENENVGAFMQQLLRFTMVTSRASGKCGGDSESRSLFPTPYSLYTPAAWPGWRVQGLQCVDKISRLTLWVS